ncbi:MAG: choice-of-anchor R domain-containing protein, partial [Candidatus Paceibacterota bacterium]
MNFIVTDERGNPDPTRIQETQIDRTALKTSTGTSKYSDFEWPYMSIVQDDWSGGRGAKNFEDDTTKFYDSWMARTDLSGKLFLGPRGNYTTGFRNLDHFAPTYDFFWKPLYGSYEGFATTFAASATYNADRAEVWLRKVGTPGTLTLKLMSDTGAGLPNAALKTATLAAATITDTVSFLHSFDWTTVQALTSGTSYWIALVAASTDDATNHWEAGYYTATGAKSVDGAAWTADTSAPFMRVLDGTFDFRPIFFEYKRGLYMVKTDREDGSHAILYINGDRGAADANTGALSTLVDASKSWTTDEHFGATVILIEGPGSEEAQPWRRVISNNGTSLDVFPDWKIEHTTATSYVIVESDNWRIVDAGGLSGDLETQVTDVAVAGDFVYFARGETNAKKVLRYEAYNKAGVWTERNEAEGFSA